MMLFVDKCENYFETKNIKNKNFIILQKKSFF